MSISKLLFLTILTLAAAHAPGNAKSERLFADVTPSVGIHFKHQVPADLNFGSGAAWIDYDRDGRLDLYVTQRVGANQLYRNLGSGLLHDFAESLGAQDALHDGSGVAIADFDNDGWRDIYLANNAERVTKLVKTTDNVSS